MTIIIYILIGWLLSALITFPILKKSALNHEEACQPFKPVFVASVIAFIPVVNIGYTLYFLYWGWREKIEVKNQDQK